MNFSRQREQIMETLRENMVHPTAEYLYEIIKKKNPKMSLATLYRNLNKMSDAGKIRKIDGLENSAHFDHNIHKHYHFICDNCKKVFDISADVAPNIAEKAQKETGFEVTEHDIVFHGLCRECKNKGE